MNDLSVILLFLLFIDKLPIPLMIDEFVSADNSVEIVDKTPPFLCCIGFSLVSAANYWCPVYFHAVWRTIDRWSQGYLLDNGYKHIPSSRHCRKYVFIFKNKIFFRFVSRQCYILVIIKKLFCVCFFCKVDQIVCTF